MKKRNTLILLGVVLVIAAVAWTLSLRGPSDETGMLLERLPKATVLALTIERGGKRIRCERAPQNARSDWRIVEPQPMRANDKAIKELIETFAYAARVRQAVKDGEEFSLADYGLDNPTHIVTLEIKPTESQRKAKPGRRPKAIITFGGPWRGKSDTVCVAFGEKCDYGVYVARASLARRSNLILTELLPRTLLPKLKLDDLQEITIASGERSTRYWSHDGQWLFHTADKLTARASKRRLTSLIDKLVARDVAVERNASDDPLGTSATTITVKTHAITVKKLDADIEPPAGAIELPDGRFKLPGVVHTARIGGPDANLAMADDLPVVFRIPEAGPSLRMSATPLLDPRLLAPCSQADVHRIEIFSPTGIVVMLRHDDDWYLPGIPPTIAADGSLRPPRADHVIVENLMAELFGSRLSEPTEGAPPQGTTDHLIVLRDDMQKRLASVEFSHIPTAERILVRRPPCSTQHFAGAGAILDRMPLDHTSLRDRTMLEEPEFGAVNITITRDGRTTTAKLDKSDADRPRWVLSAPAQGEVDSTAIRHILRTFRSLRAQRFLSPDERGRAAMGMANPTTVTVAYRPPKGADIFEHTLLIGSPAAGSDGGYYARLAGSDEAFILAGHVADAVPDSLASRIVSQARNVVRLRIVSGDASTAFINNPKLHAWTDEAGRKLDAAAMKRLKPALKLLAKFQGERIAAFTGAGRARYGFDKPWATIVFDEYTIKGKRITIGAAAGAGLRYAKGPVSGYVLVVRESDVQKLTALTAK